jgi:hypothetical protein
MRGNVSKLPADRAARTTPASDRKPRLDGTRERGAAHAGHRVEERRRRSAVGNRQRHAGGGELAERSREQLRFGGGSSPADRGHGNAAIEWSHARTRVQCHCPPAS